MIVLMVFISYKHKLEMTYQIIIIILINVLHENNIGEIEI